MNVAIRADASERIGSGHVRRCLVLAKKFKNIGAEKVYFISKENNGNLKHEVETSGFIMYLLKDTDWEEDAIATKSIISTPVDLLIVDHYALDYRWEKFLREMAKKVLVIDDLADRKHDCDFLLDQNYYKNSFYRYKNLVPEYCKCFFGPEFSLLRSEFIDLECSSNFKSLKEDVSRVNISMGGSDPKEATYQCLEYLLKIEEYTGIIDVIVSYLKEESLEKLKNLCAINSRINLYQSPKNYIYLCSKADLVIGSGGTSHWERMYMGLPTIAIATAKNQEEGSKTLSNAGYVTYLGPIEEVSLDIFKKTFIELLYNHEKRNRMSILGKNLVDARGSDRILSCIVQGM